jgi:hypothetical protein
MHGGMSIKHLLMNNFLILLLQMGHEKHFTSWMGTAAARRVRKQSR